MSYRESLIELLFHLSDESIKRLYRLANYLYPESVSLASN